jgi:hypothetical protein
MGKPVIKDCHCALCEEHRNQNEFIYNNHDPKDNYDYKLGKADALKELREKLPNTISHDWSEPVIDDDFIEGKEHGWNSCLSEVIKLIEELEK